MKLIAKTITSVAVAAVAAITTTWLTGDSHAALLLFFAFCGATITTALLVSIPDRSATSTPRKNKPKPRRAPKPVADKSTPRDTSSDEEREHGRVKWFNVSKGFGFITRDNGEEIFVHFRSIRGGGRRGLRDDQEVTFITAESDKGPQAEDVEGIE